MNIDNERLKTDRGYWDEFDPTKGHATHFDTEDHQDMPWMMFKNGDWFAFDKPENPRMTGSFIGPLNPVDDDWLVQENWKNCIPRPGDPT